jgi:hypothetical protein
MITTKQKVVGAAVGVVAVVSGSTAAVWAATSSSATPSATSAAASSSSTPAVTVPDHLGKRLQRLTHVIHGEFEVKDKSGQIVTLDADTGTLTQATAASVTVARQDGKTVTIELSSTTRYGKGHTESNLQTGKGVLVLSKAGTAVAVLQRAA